MRYAIVLNETVVNVTISETDFAVKQGWLEVADSVSVGWIWNGSEWVDPNPPVVDSADSVSA